MSNMVPHEFEGLQVRTVQVDGTTCFVGKDAAEALGNADATTAIRLHCRGVQIPHPLRPLATAKQTASLRRPTQVPLRCSVSADDGRRRLDGPHLVGLQQSCKNVLKIRIPFRFQLRRKLNWKLESLHVLQLLGEGLVHVHKTCGEQITDRNLRKSLRPLISRQLRKKFLKDLLGHNILLACVALLKSGGRFSAQGSIVLSSRGY